MAADSGRKTKKSKIERLKVYLFRTKPKGSVLQPGRCYAHGRCAFSRQYAVHIPLSLSVEDVSSCAFDSCSFVFVKSSS